jgi:LytTr DNA-binding domain
MEPRVQPPLRETTAPTREAPAAATGASSNAAAWLRNMAIAAAAGVFLALSSAMETGALPLYLRLAYWLPLMLGGALVGHGVAALIRRAPGISANRWVFGAVLTVGIAIPITFIVSGYTSFVFGTRLTPSTLPGVFFSVLVISTAMTAIMIAVNWPGRVTHASASAPAPVRFLERLPPKLRGGALYAISAEDHYLRLHTSKGADLILMRLADAIVELDGVEGAQTHRSWWVARDAVQSARRDGDRIVLLLKGGAEAPVSRPNVRSLRDAGWF